jgi:2-methylisocitrate lyase-like PEP mutase family enzyme
MSLDIQREKADAFRKMHDRSRILVLPNAWDVASARIVEQAGFRAVATTSAGVAWSLGYPDGEGLGRDEMLEVVRRIASRVAVPVTADMVAGFANSATEVPETVRRLIAAGAIGMNMEDGTHDENGALVDVAVHVAKVRAAREAGAAAGVPIVINARTDVYLAQIGEPASRLRHAVERANAYREAGADCLFVPGVRDADTIARLVREINGPVNILAGGNAPSIRELEQLGTARVSLGSGPMAATIGLLKRIMDDLRGPGTYRLINENAVAYAEINRLMELSSPTSRD